MPKVEAPVLSGPENPDLCGGVGTFSGEGISDQSSDSLIAKSSAAKVSIRLGTGFPLLKGINMAKTVVITAAATGIDQLSPQQKCQRTCSRAIKQTRTTDIVVIVTVTVIN